MTRRKIRYKYEEPLAFHNYESRKDGWKKLACNAGIQLVCFEFSKHELFKTVRYHNIRFSKKNKEYYASLE